MTTNNLDQKIESGFKAFFAAFIEFFFPGAGSVYLNKKARAFAVFLIWLALEVLNFVLNFVVLKINFSAFLFLLLTLGLVSLVFRIFIATKTFQSAQKKSVQPKRHLFLYLFLGFVFYVPIVLTISKLEEKHLLKIRSFKVSGEGMSPIFFKKETVVTLSASETNKVKREQTVVFQNEGSPYPFFKRVVALSGEKIKVKDGIVIVNDSEIQLYVEKSERLRDWLQYISSKNDSTYKKMISIDGYTVPKNHFFVIGDNYANSLDSRFYGAIQKDSIQGIVVYKLIGKEQEGKFSWKRSFQTLEQ